MTGFALGPMPGTSMAEAADIIMGESGHFPAFPQLPQRGVGSDAVGRTAGLLEGLAVERGPRSWRLSNRPQLLTHRLWDRLDRDVDEVQAVWGESVPLLKVQVLGPWSLAAALELANGHRAITDRGALEDLTAALQEGIGKHVHEIARRFNGQVRVQLDEPALPAILAGRIPGTTDFDSIPAVAAEVALERLARFGADFLHTAPLWELAPAATTLLTAFDGLDNSRDLDGLGQWLSAGGRVGLGIAGRDARAEAIALARHFDQMGLPRELLVEQVDVYPVLADAARLREVVATAGMLQRDAGGL
ncbi:methionine synthase [Corynebacterium lizhenjunii]|uniref:methionine synthase n=1 Tax=Corynebacterium lizhenjunii TaxID=2709394 RepID=UPI0013ED73F6